MKKKKIYSLRVLGETVSKNIRDDDFYTTDTDTWLEFSLVDTKLIPETMSISLVNSNDGSAVNEVVTLTGTKTILYRLDPEIIVHAGTWQGQVVFEANGEMYTSKSFAFGVSSNVMDNNVPQLIKIANFNHFNKMLEELTQQGEEFEGIVARAREQIDENILTTALEDKYASVESEYAPRLTTLEQNDVSLTAQLQQAVGAVTVDSEVVLARGGEPTLGVRLDKQDDTTKDITSRVSYIEGYIDYRDDDIVGIEADFANSTFTRIAASSGLSAGTDFNAFEPFGGRRRCTVLDNGTVTSYFGDVNFAEDGSIGQVMVEQPKFYYKVVPLKLDKVQDGKGFHLRKARYYVSAKHKAGFKIHPAFVRNGKEKNFIYLSAYEGALYDDSATAYILDDAQVADFATDKLSSISGTKPASGVTQNLTRANTRKLAQNRGLGWEQAYGATVAATQLLFAIEYASFNTQTAIGMGVSKTDDGKTNMAEPTGATTLLGNASGKADNGSITYRGEENFWMNIWKWIDGLNIEAKGLHNLFVADNAFADDLGTAPYQDAGITLAKTSGYISAFAYNEKFDWLFFPSETSGNSSVPVGDYLYQNNTHNGWFPAILGGTWISGTDGGGFYWNVATAASDRTRTRGGRLVYVPGVVA